ncbi:hypothetical protein DY000_02022452 [Brassica cretica]|uniref:Uncharacterized protein n=1 Tax=Brassica cretica TaxID=69181 RepID=A0ABQ7E8N5_BRACR|nr:hypothetical protein DY000_02022452 [Brassica cretica]
MEAETLGNEEKVSKMRKTSEPEETKEQTEDNEESKHKKKEEVAEDDMNVQEILVKQTADVQENGNVNSVVDSSFNHCVYVFSHRCTLFLLQNRRRASTKLDLQAAALIFSAVSNDD